MKLALTRPQVSSQSGDTRLAVKAGIGRVFGGETTTQPSLSRIRLPFQVQDHLTLTLCGPVLSLINEMIYMSQRYYHKYKKAEW